MQGIADECGAVDSNYHILAMYSHMLANDTGKQQEAQWTPPLLENLLDKIDR